MFNLELVSKEAEIVSVSFHYNSMVCCYRKEINKFAETYGGIVSGSKIEFETNRQMFDFAEKLSSPYRLLLISAEGASLCRFALPKLSTYREKIDALARERGGNVIGSEIRFQTNQQLTDFFSEISSLYQL